jgi:hypothetical protein
MISKFFEAVKILRPNTEMIWHEESEEMTEEEFNKVLWKTGENETGEAITTTTCPHSELTWTKVKEEMDKL